MLNLLVALLALLVASSAAAQQTCLVVGPGACTMSSISDGNCVSAGTMTGCTPDAGDGFTINGGTSEVISFDIDDSTGAGGTFQIDFAPPGVTAMSTGPIPTIAIGLVGTNPFFAHAMNYDMYVSGWTALSGIDTETLQISFGGDYGNTDIEEAWVTCTGNGSNITCSSLTEAVAGVAVPVDAGELIITGDWIHNNANNVEILCKGGGKITVDTDNEVRITLPKGTVSGVLYGLNAKPGCEVNMLGRWYPFGVASPALSSEPVGNEWPVGDVVPCAKALAGDIVTDCATNPESMGIKYTDKWQPHPDDITGDEDPFVKQSLALVDASDGQVVLQFVDHSFGAANDIANDVNAAYEVTTIDATDTGGTEGAFDDPMGIIFDLHQGDFDQVGWPETRIDVVQSDLTVAATIGSRLVTVESDVLNILGVADQFNYARRWLRFADAAGDPECESYAIMRIDDGIGDDVITLLDVRGLRKAYPVDRVMWIDNGMKCGDTFILTHAIEIDSATPINVLVADTLRDSHIGNRGKMTLKGFRTLGIPDYQLFMADPDTQFSYGAAHDITKNTLSSDWMNFYNTEKATVGPVMSFSAGTTGATFFGGHGFMASSSGLVHIRDVSARHLGDDVFACDADNSENTRELRVERSIAEMALDDADSGGGLDTISKCGVNFDKAVMSNTSDKLAVNAVISPENPQGICRFNEVAVLSTLTAPATIAQDVTAVECVATNWFVAGIQQTSSISGGMYPTATNQFVVRDSTFSITFPNIGYGGSTVSYLKNGYFDRINTNAGFMGFGRGIQTFQNIGIFDANLDTSYGLSSNGLLTFTSFAEADFIFDKVTVAWRPDSVTATERGFYNNGSPENYGTFSNFVFAGMHDACSGGTPDIITAIQINSGQSGALVGGWWNFFDNNWCASAGVFNYGLSRIWNATLLIVNLRANASGFSQDDPKFYDPANGQFWPVRGSFNATNGVGMQKGAGLCKKTWPMKVLDLEPECQSDGAGGGGGGGGGMKSW